MRYQRRKCTRRSNLQKTLLVESLEARLLLAADGIHFDPGHEPRSDRPSSHSRPTPAHLSEHDPWVRHRKTFATPHGERRFESERRHGKELAPPAKVVAPRLPSTVIPPNEVILPEDPVADVPIQQVPIQHDPIQQNPVSVRPAESVVSPPLLLESATPSATTLALDAVLASNAATSQTEVLPTRPVVPPAPLPVWTDLASLLSSDSGLSLEPLVRIDLRSSDQSQLPRTDPAATANREVVSDQAPYLLLTTDLQQAAAIRSVDAWISSFPDDPAGWVVNALDVRWANWIQENELEFSRFVVPEGQISENESSEILSEGNDPLDHVPLRETADSLAGLIQLEQVRETSIEQERSAENEDRSSPTQADATLDTIAFLLRSIQHDDPWPQSSASAPAESSAYDEPFADSDGMILLGRRDVEVSPEVAQTDENVGLETDAEQAEGRLAIPIDAEMAVFRAAETGMLNHEALRDLRDFVVQIFVISVLLTVKSLVSCEDSSDQRERIDGVGAKAPHWLWPLATLCPPWSKLCVKQTQSDEMRCAMFSHLFQGMV